MSGWVPSPCRDQLRERDMTIQRLAEALKQWREWAGRHQANLYHGDLTDDGYEALGGLIAETSAALREAGIE